MAIQPILQTGLPSELSARSGWPVQGEWRYADYLRLPNDGRRYEIIEGILYVANAPEYDHQFAVAEITFGLKSYVNAHKLGVVLNAPFEVHLAELTRPVQPAVLFIRAEQQPHAGDKFFAGAPDLVVEVISPTSIRRDRQIKFDAYEKAGVAEYWLADPKTRSVEIYTLSSGEYALLGQFTADETITSNVLPGLTLNTSTLFA